MTSIKPISRKAPSEVEPPVKFVRPGPRESCVRQIGQAEDLHASPTFFITFIVALLTAGASYFVSEYIVDVVRTESVFMLGSYVTFTSYFMFHYYLEKYSSSYRAVDSDKQFYVLANLIKSAVLAAMTPFAVHLLYQTLVLNEWHTQRIRNLGCMYCIPDFISLLLVNKMSRATKAHHICVCIFNYLSCNNDYSKENICRLIVVYAVFSTLAYMVNLLLASRFLNVSRRVFISLSVLSLAIYAGACVLNWSWQVWYLYRLITINNHWSVYAYTGLLCTVVYDDLVLNKWLLKNIVRQRAVKEL